MLMTKDREMTLQKWRKENGRSKYRVAKDLGVHWMTVHRWETSVHSPRNDELQRIATYTGGQVTAADFKARAA